MYRRELMLIHYLQSRLVNHPRLLSNKLSNKPRFYWKIFKKEAGLEHLSTSTNSFNWNWFVPRLLLAIRHSPPLGAISDIQSSINFPFALSAYIALPIRCLGSWLSFLSSGRPIEFFFFMQVGVRVEWDWDSLLLFDGRSGGGMVRNGHLRVDQTRWNLKRCLFFFILLLTARPACLRRLHYITYFACFPWLTEARVHVLGGWMDGWDGICDIQREPNHHYNIYIFYFFVFQGVRYRGSTYVGC